jgi:mannose-6-phosphate isomerase-like protein (cupin superfamily)
MDEIHLRVARQVLAPDGSTVHLLLAVDEGGMAVFELPADAVARTVRHPRVQEIWFVLAGYGRIWRRTEAGAERVLPLEPGVSLTIARRTSFQFRCDGPQPLQILGVTMPAWAGGDDAELVEGYWPSTV